MDKFELRFSIAEDWQPVPRYVADNVIPLKDSDGNVMAYVETGETFHERKGVPSQFFDDHKRKVSPDSPEKFAGFMSIHGLIGLQRKRCPMIDGIAKVRSLEDARNMDRQYRFIRGANRRTGDYWWTDQDILHWYQKLQKAAEDAGLGWQYQASHPLAPLIRVHLLVTKHEADEGYRNLLMAWRVFDVLSHTESIYQAAKILGWDNYNIENNCAFWTNYLNNLLQDVSPQIELRRVIKNESPNRYPLIGGEECETEIPEGTFDQAAALQIYKRLVDNNMVGKNKYKGYKQCKECGNYFTDREIHNRKRRTRSDIQFCSRACKNRYTQREYRKRQRDLKSAQQTKGNAQ